jgi:hypothetical protein
MGMGRDASSGRRLGYHRVRYAGAGVFPVSLQRIPSCLSSPLPPGPDAIMNSHLPYRATMATGETIDVTFDLHVDTRSEVDVSALLTSLLVAIDTRVEDREGVSNGDVLQALAMAMALRVAMIPAPRTVTEPLARDLLDTALSCASFAQRVPAPAVRPEAASPAAASPAIPQP